MRQRATVQAAILHRVGFAFDPRQRADSARLFRFCLVGGSGVLLNNLALVLLHEVLGLPLVAAASLAVEVAIISNFYWNNRWTFRQRALSLGRLGKFNLVSLGGLGIATATIWLLSEVLSLHYLLGNLAGISLAMVWNFAVNSAWTWGWRP